jgi:succinate dehydrogenase/fumarate reductase cytochrome b subunit
MKKILTTCSAALAASQFFAVKALAALNNPPEIAGLKTGGGDTNAIKNTIVDLLLKVLDFITLLGVIFVVVAGIRLIVSGGDEGEKDKAKKTIIYVIIGIIVILFARVIVSFFASL